MNDAPDNRECAADAERRPRVEGRVSPGRLRALVVDDDESARQALAQAVRSFGMICNEACDGAEAWDALQHETYDVVISDWHMPRMNGLELCQRMREAGAERELYTYFILITGMGGERGFRDGMEAGADDYQTKPIDLDELQARLVTATRVVHVYEALAQKNALLRRESQRAILNAHTDPLTRISNRLGLEKDLEGVWARAQRYNHRCSVAMCDIDDFKRYNDKFGHLAGDDALRKVAHAIKESLRVADGVYRYGGEEFLVLLPEQSAEDARRAMERVRESVAAMRIQAPDTSVVVTISIGVAELTPGADWSVEHCIERADRALYEAKERGKNRVVLANAIAKKGPTPQERWR